MAVSVGEVGRGEGAAAGGRHCGHSSGRIWVHRTDLGPCTSQKCVKESYTKSAGRHSSRADDGAAYDEIHVEVGKQVTSERHFGGTTCAMRLALSYGTNIDHLDARICARACFLDAPINKGAVRTGKLCRVQGQRTGKEYGGVSVRPRCSNQKASTICR